MTVPFNNELYQAVTPGGAIFLQVSFETYIGSGIAQPVTGAQLAITSVASGATVLTTSNLLTPDQATFTYQWLPATTVTPGDYTASWTGTGPDGAIAYSSNVTVVSPPLETPTPGVYCTPGQYQAWSGDLFTPVTLVQTWIRRASEVIDIALIGAVYESDANGMPLESSTIDAFMRACAAQTQFMIANNDPANVKFLYSGTSTGGVSASRAPGTMNGSMPKLAPQAAAIFRVAGVLPSAPLINWG